MFGLRLWDVPGVGVALLVRSQVVVHLGVVVLLLSVYRDHHSFGEVPVSCDVVCLGVGLKAEHAVRSGVIALD